MKMLEKNLLFSILFITVVITIESNLNLEGKKSFSRRDTQKQNGINHSNIQDNYESFELDFQKEDNQLGGDLYENLDDNKEIGTNLKTIINKSYKEPIYEGNRKTKIKSILSNYHAKETNFDSAVKNNKNIKDNSSFNNAYLYKNKNNPLRKLSNRNMKIPTNKETGIKETTKEQYIDKIISPTNSKGLCNMSNCKYGNCINNSTTCVCYLGYTTFTTEGKRNSKYLQSESENYSNIYNYNHVDSNSNITYCNYKQKEQFKAFLLETILIFGVGHFYSGRVLFGLIKALFFLLIISLDLMIKKTLSKKNSKTNNLYFCASFVFYFIIVSLHLYDIVMLGLNKYTDGYGVELFERE